MALTFRKVDVLILKEWTFDIKTYQGWPQLEDKKRLLFFDYILERYNNESQMSKVSWLKLTLSIFGLFALYEVFLRNT